jgi:hypothetical protein
MKPRFLTHNEAVEKSIIMGFKIRSQYFFNFEYHAGFFYLYQFIYEKTRAVGCYILVKTINIFDKFLIMGVCFCTESS